MRSVLIVTVSALVLGACSSSPENSPHASEAMAAYDVAEPPPPPKEVAESPAPLSVTLPQLAYAYALGFRLPDAKVAEAQEAHRARCEQMGRARCQLIALRRGLAEDQQSDATLKLRIANGEARAFADWATGTVATAGGRAVTTSVVAEDVSKDIVDTEARIRQREMLVARLTDILRRGAGKVAELVEAERSVATAQEELDQARGWLTELRGRVAMSDFEIRYAAVAPATTPRQRSAQLGDAITGSAAAFAAVVKGLLTLLIYLAPWLLVLVPVALLANAAAKRALRADAIEPETAPPAAAAPETDEA